MTDLVLRDIDPQMADRIKRLADAQGATMHDTLELLIQRGLQTCEANLHVVFNDRESNALEAAVAALESVESDKGFGLIGRAPPPPPPRDTEQTFVLAERWVEEI